MVGGVRMLTSALFLARCAIGSSATISIEAGERHIRSRAKQGHWSDDLYPDGKILPPPQGLELESFKSDSVITGIIWQCSRSVPAPLRGQLLDANYTSPTLKALVDDHFATLTSKLANFGKVKDAETTLLHQMVKQLQPLTTGETGLASGTSALAMLSALPPSSTHVSIDPFQRDFDEQGVKAARRYARLHRKRFVHFNETAAFGLSYLQTRQVCFDLFFIDDGHKFDDTITELWHASKLLSVGGVLVFHDTWMRAVTKCVKFVNTNLKHLKQVGDFQSVAIFVKVGQENRFWNHYVNF